MIKIDWKSRVGNRAFWITFTASVLLLVQVVLKPFGIEFETELLNGQLDDIINALFGVLAILGVVMNPQTNGFSDSNG